MLFKIQHLDLWPNCSPVHSHPELSAPLGDPERESSVQADGAKRHCTVSRSALVSQDAADQAKLEQGGRHVEHDCWEDEANASASPVYGLRKGACLTIQVECQV